MTVGMWRRADVTETEAERGSMGAEAWCHGVKGVTKRVRGRFPSVQQDRRRCRRPEKGEASPSSDGRHP